MRAHTQRAYFGINRKNQQEQKHRLISRVSVVVVLVLACFGYEEFLANSIRESSAGASSFLESHGTTTGNPQQNKEVAKTSTANLRLSVSTNKGGVGTSGSGNISVSTPGNNQQQQQQVGEEGGAWTAQTHLSHYGFNAD